MGELAKNEQLQVVKQDNKYGIDASTWSALKNIVYTGSTDEAIKLVIDYCKANKLDPLKKPVHIIAGGKWGADKIWAGIGLYRTQASRSGCYAGISEPEFGEDVTETMTTECWENNKKGAKEVQITYPKWCKITAKKIVQGVVVEFSVKEFWKENYSKGKGNSTAPNDMWEKRAYGQIAKCAEAQALRKAFPEFISQEPTAEEMEGKVLHNVTTQEVNHTPTSSTSNLDKFLEKEAPKLEVVEEVVEEDIHLKLVRLAEMHKLSDVRVKAWCKAGDVDSLMDLDEAKTIACINSLQAQSGINGHSVLKQV
jgi:phage recombination protein Bet